MESKKIRNSKRRQAQEPRSARPSLTPEGIVQAALKIMDEDGYKSLSMRRLGAKLNVDPMAVYYHFPNKLALLDGVVELVHYLDGTLLDRTIGPAADAAVMPAQSFIWKFREEFDRHIGGQKCPYGNRF